MGSISSLLLCLFTAAEEERKRVEKEKKKQEAEEKERLAKEKAKYYEDSQIENDGKF